MKSNELKKKNLSATDLQILSNLWRIGYRPIGSTVGYGCDPLLEKVCDPLLL
jgi:hypothetical protein